MAEPRNNNKAIVITADDARGALGPQNGSAGNTLLPMLIGMIVLTIVGVVVVIMMV